jgi:hypothetical protein
VANIPDPLPDSAVEIGRYTTNVAYLWNGTDPSVWPSQKVILGAWDESTGIQAGQSYDVNGAVIGTPTYPINPNYWTYIRPLGNVDDVATDYLDSIRFAGHSEPKFAVDARRYPNSNAPFTLRMTRTLITNDGFPNIPWGWTAEIIAADPERVVTARAIGIYSDPAWANYLYTTGAFSLNATTGLYTSVCPVGQRKAAPEPIYYSLLWGSLQEGNWQLTDLTEGAVQGREHWQFNQGEVSYELVQVGPEVLMPPTLALLSPQGYAVDDIASFSANRIFLKLDQGFRDSADPTLVFHLPSGIETVGMIWNELTDRYISGSETGLRAKLLATIGERIRIELRWL